MATQFITNDKDVNSNNNLSDEYKLMIDIMIEEEVNGQAEYVSLDEVKNRFCRD